jgi:putative flippase GtrA
VKVLRQTRHFMVFGIVQWMADWVTLVGLSALGMPVASANITGRIVGAILGFWLNGRFTFAHDASTLGWPQLVRYIALWGANTTISTFAISAIHAHANLYGAWLAKPLVEGILGLGTFLVSRYWVYR